MFDAESRERRFTTACARDRREEEELSAEKVLLLCAGTELTAARRGALNEGTDG